MSRKCLLSLLIGKKSRTFTREIYNSNIMRVKSAIFLSVMVLHLPLQADEVWMVGPSDVRPTSTLYVNNRAPLPANPFIKLAPAAVVPRGWIGEMLVRQKNGLSGQLGEISDWLDKKGNAWLEPGGSHGWEEVPYWLRGYANLAYILNDKTMIDETKFWIEGILRSSQLDGFLGPVNENKGRRELWANMLALQILQDYYEWCGDERVINLLGSRTLVCSQEYDRDPGYDRILTAQLLQCLVSV